MEFFKQRKEVLRNELKKVLALTNENPPEEMVEWNGRYNEIENQEGWIAREAME